MDIRDVFSAEDLKLIGKALRVYRKRVWSGERTERIGLKLK